MLASDEVLSTDEDSSDSGGESEDELGRNLESLLFNKKTAVDLSHEQEEAERQELRRLLMEDQPVSTCIVHLVKYYVHIERICAQLMYMYCTIIIFIKGPLYINIMVVYTYMYT